MQLMSYQETKTSSKKTFIKVLAGAIAVNLVLIGCLVAVEIIIKDITVTVNGKTAVYKTAKASVDDLLDSWNVELDQKDVVAPGKEAELEDGMDVNIKLFEVREETVEEETPFKKTEYYTSDLLEDEKKITQEGVKGLDSVTYKVTYLGGEEQSRKEIDRKTVRKPVTQKTALGTAVAINGERYSRKLVVQATAYTGGGRTASGTRARVGEIAVDPRVIPLGSECYIEGFGKVRAEDTGGAVKGNIIDIYMSSYGQCRSWGRRYVTIYVK